MIYHSETVGICGGTESVPPKGKQKCTKQGIHLYHRKTLMTQGKHVIMYCYVLFYVSNPAKRRRFPMPVTSKPQISFFTFNNPPKNTLTNKKKRHKNRGIPSESKGKVKNAWAIHENKIGVMPIQGVLEPYPRPRLYIFKMIRPRRRKRWRPAKDM